MFEHKKLDQPDYIELIDIYANFIESKNQLFAHQTAGLDVTAERMRFHKLTLRMDKMYAALPDNKREILVEALVIRKLLPEELKKILQEFNGKVVSLS